MKSAWTLSYSEPGCYYSNQYKPATYGYSRVPNVPIHIRYYKDSFISADELTYGCSSSSTSSDSCFGISRKQQNTTGSIVTGIGALLVLLEIAAFLGLCAVAEPANQPSYQPQPGYQPQPAYGQPIYGQPQN